MHNYIKFQDLLIKFPFDHPLSEGKIKSITIQTSYNSAIEDKKLLYSVIFIYFHWLGQLPAIVKAKRSIATFKLKQGMPIGILTTLHGWTLQLFLQNLILNLPLFWPEGNQRTLPNTDICSLTNTNQVNIGVPSIENFKLLFLQNTNIETQFRDLKLTNQSPDFGFHLILSLSSSSKGSQFQKLIKNKMIISQNCFPI